MCVCNGVNLFQIIEDPKQTITTFRLQRRKEDEIPVDSAETAVNYFWSTSYCVILQGWCKSTCRIQTNDNHIVKIQYENLRDYLQEMLLTENNISGVIPPRLHTYLSNRLEEVMWGNRNENRFVKEGKNQHLNFLQGHEQICLLFQSHGISIS